jgi:hypothetical protein
MGSMEKNAIFVAGPGHERAVQSVTSFLHPGRPEAHGPHSITGIVEGSAMRALQAAGMLGNGLHVPGNGKADAS